MCWCVCVCFSLIRFDKHIGFCPAPQREKQQVEEMLKDVRRNEEEMCQSNQSLLTRLEDVQVKTRSLSVSEGGVGLTS